MKTHYILIIFICGLLMSCGDANNAKSNSKSTAAAANAAANKTPTGAELPSIPNEIMKILWEQCDYTDFIFHNLPFSMSQDEKASIQSTLHHISGEALGSIPAGCKPEARQFFHIKGEILYEADVYIKEGCYFYVFVEKEKPVYANKMSQNGITFFNNTIKQALGSAPK